MKIINPATEEILQELEEDSMASLEEKYKKLKAGQSLWANVSIEQRIAMIAKFYDLLDQHKDKLAHTLTSEMGKPLQQSYNELNGARSRIQFFIDNAAKY